MADSAAPVGQVDVSFLARLSRDLIKEVQGLRKDSAEIRRMTLMTMEYAQRLDRRFADSEFRQNTLKDDLHIMLKMELGGSLSHLESVFDQKIGYLSARLDELAGVAMPLERPD